MLGVPVRPDRTDARPAAMSRVNRRNYYRILQVQPDAHEAVIRTAYRTLMQKLRLHPDLGGDGATATLINEAYAVLSDPVRRADYDARLGPRPARAAPQSAPQPMPVAATAHRLPVTEHADDPEICPFCAAQVPPATTKSPAPRCSACASPLSPPPAARRLGAARRAFERQTVAVPVEYFLRGTTAPAPAALRDFSPAGAQLTTPRALPANTVLALKTPLFDALARVVRCEPTADTPGQWLLRLEFLTLTLTAPAGSLVSTRA
ncbi:DnaJ domain-containing protein [Immundisolibacter sp.]